VGLSHWLKMVRPDHGFEPLDQNGSGQSRSIGTVSVTSQNRSIGSGSNGADGVELGLTAVVDADEVRRLWFQWVAAPVVLELHQGVNDVQTGEAGMMARWPGTRRSTAAGRARQSSCGALWSLTWTDASFWSTRR
jgi:hypothetical protein